MKNNKFKFLYYLIIIILIIFLIFNRQIFDKISEYKEKNMPDSFSEYIPVSTYYYKSLSDSQKKAYICLFNGIKECEKKITIPKMSEDDLSNVFEAVQFDNPDIFYVGDKGYIVNTAGSCYFEPEYLMNNSEISKYTKQIDEIVLYIRNCTDGMDKYSKELFIHDYIAQSCSYSQVDFDNTVYGCLINKKAVCSGYSYAFMYLANKCGIECNVITGSATDKNNITSSHMWNIVRLDNEYYFTDVTWDDIDSGKDDSYIHLYFNASYSQIIKNHTPETDLSKLYYGSQYNYFVKNGLSFSSYNRNIIDGLIDKCVNNINSGIYSIEILFTDKTGYCSACDNIFYKNTNSDLAYLIYHINLKANKTVNSNSVSYIKNDTLNYIKISFSG